MSDFTFTDGVARISDPALYTTWQERPDYIGALIAARDPANAAKKRLVMNFEVALARVMRAGTVETDIDGVLERFLAEDYIQHDPNIPSGRPGLAAFFRAGAFGAEPPPPIALAVDGEVVFVLMQLPVPDPTEPTRTYDLFTPTAFRVRDGQLVEHWGAQEKHR